MTDINDVIAEIRETSAKAEHGPWRAQPCEPDARYSDIKGDLDLGWWAHIARGVKNENAAHIAACCPENMAAVLAHIGTLTRERDEARGLADLRDRRIKQLLRDSHEAAAENAAVEAMRARCEVKARGIPVAGQHRLHSADGTINGGNWSPDSQYGKGRHDSADAIAALKVERITPAKGS